ncbi:hypothetical protein HPB47_014089 [Ixodes persulcatus]|uniref:Uncharacterized protein n=1 Tax=Ixodes persulcatus TaxID=34615 RepID=A0AC60R158_IXOPE|nr:hypothetical protein HPB47_014089 [Ixodes persulcatus]
MDDSCKRRRKTGGGSSRERLSSTYFRILCIVGLDSALGAPGLRVPYFPEEEVQSVGAPAEQHPASLDVGEVLKEEAEEVDDADQEASTSTLSQQEQRDRAAFSAVANQQHLLDANVGRDTRDERFQGQITLGMGQLLERLDQVAQNVRQQAQSMDRIAENIQEGVLFMQQNAAFMRENISVTIHS